MNETFPPTSASGGISFADKSSLYREVLAIDPGSRIFLPYARMLEAEGLHAEAAEVLEKGLSVCPEFLEARLFLIEILHSMGKDSAAAVQASGIIEALSSSPSFWKVWSRFPGVRTDQAAMLLFLSACMRSRSPVSLSDVFEAGILAVSGEETEKTPVSRNENTDITEVPFSPMPVSDTVNTEAAASETVSSEIPDQDDRGYLPWYALDEVPEEDDLPDDEPGAPEKQDRTAEPAPGKSSLRTRTMAMLLEEQGAADEAAEIYRELMRFSASPEEKAELAARIDNLSQNGVVQQPSQPQLVNILEKLAERLENRSRA